MKHLYWIICGVAILGLLAIWLLVVPASEARLVKKDLDDRSADLKDLEKRAKNQPSGEFNTENPVDTQHLARDFLITERWLGVLQPHLEKYKGQLAALKKQLIGRGEWLRRPVSQTTDKYEWYKAYSTAADTLVARLAAANCLRLPSTIKTVHPGPEGEAPTDLAGGEGPSEVRTTAGLYTKGTAFPDPKEYPLLTAKLRIMEMIADRLITARIAVQDNPLVGPTGRSGDRNQASARLLRTSWEGGTSSDQISHPIASALTPLLIVQSVDLSLEFEGPLSALLAATAALEVNAETDRPLIAVTSSTLSRLPELPAGARFDVAGEPVRLELSLSVLEFLDQPEVTPPPAAASAPTSKPPPKKKSRTTKSSEDN